MQCTTSVVTAGNASRHFTVQPSATHTPSERLHFAVDFHRSQLYLALNAQLLLHYYCLTMYRLARASVVVVVS